MVGPKTYARWPTILYQINAKCLNICRTPFRMVLFNTSTKLKWTYGVGKGAFIDYIVS